MGGKKYCVVGGINFLYEIDWNNVMLQTHLLLKYEKKRKLENDCNFVLKLN